MTDNKIVLVVIGPPGSGKGTQAAKLKDFFNIGHISIGELLRNEVSAHTSIGEKIEEKLAHGDIVPSTVIQRLLLKRIQEDDCKNGLILDGFPRTITQTQLFERVIRAIGSQVTAVIDYELKDEDGILRIKGRAIKDKEEGKAIREDDLNEDIIKHRFVVYHEKTQPLISYFKQTNKLVKIDANASVEDIFEKTVEKIQNILKKSK